MLAQQLRGRPPLIGTETLLSEQERAELAPSKNVAMAVMFRQGQVVREAFEAGQFDVRQAIYLEETLSHLTNHQGGCERIKKTVFPAHLQDPFEENRNSTPMSTIARMLETNTRELLGEKYLPEPLASVDGAAW